MKYLSGSYDKSRSNVLKWIGNSASVLALLSRLAQDALKNPFMKRKEVIVSHKSL